MSVEQAHPYTEVPPERSDEPADRAPDDPFAEFFAHKTGRSRMDRTSIADPTGNLVGYARVSTVEQNLDLQIDALTAAGCTRIFSEHKSGATSDRPQLKALCDYLRPGDTVVVWRFDRLARSVSHLLAFVTACARADIHLRSLQDAIDTSTPVGVFQLQLVGALAELERNTLIERTKAGLDAARARGIVGGRRPVVDSTKARKIIALYGAGCARKDIAADVGISYRSCTRFLSEYLDISEKGPAAFIEKYGFDPDA